MLSIVLKLIIVSIVFGKIQGQHGCNQSYCNYEGTCEVLNESQKKCSCVANVSKGDKCEDFIDTCVDTGKKLCKMGSKCKYVCF